MKPNPRNFCGGNFQDWIEVMLTPKCNGSCAWCVDKDGFHPKDQAHWRTLVAKLKEVGRKNVILLGGEPTLYKPLHRLVDELVVNGHNVYMTTNGAIMRHEVRGLAGINISIHHHNLGKSQQITGLKLNYGRLMEHINFVKWRDNTKIRFNCTLQKGFIDNEAQILTYIAFAKDMGADSIRIAELKHDNDFVDLYEIFGSRYGLTNNPYTDGCSTDAVILGMPVSFRQMCGIQTPFRPAPINPEPQSDRKTVLYYNGKVYSGWQTKEREIIDMAKKLSVKEILARVKSGKMSTETAEKLLEKRASEKTEKVVNRYEGIHCQY